MVELVKMQHKRYFSKSNKDQDLKFVDMMPLRYEEGMFKKWMCPDVHSETDEWQNDRR